MSSIKRVSGLTSINAASFHSQHIRYASLLDRMQVAAAFDCKLRVCIIISAHDMLKDFWKVYSYVQCMSRLNTIAEPGNSPS